MKFVNTSVTQLLKVYATHECYWTPNRVFKKKIHISIQKVSMQ